MATLAQLKTELGKIKKQLLGTTTADQAKKTLSAVSENPAAIFGALGMQPDPWQIEFMTSESRRESLLCCRQAGKSTVTAARVLRDALVHPQSDCLVFSPTLRQSMELLRKVRNFYNALGKPVAPVAITKTALELANGSRVISLPDSQEGVVGFSAPRLVVIDEGSRVSDELYASVRPMLAASRGTLITLSTPFGNEGWFYRIWDDSAEGVERRSKLNEQWRLTAVTADSIPRIDPQFLEDERIELGERWFQQEYYLAFLDAIDAVFSQSVIHGARSEGIEPLFDLAT